MPERYSTAQVAALAGIHRDTLLRWLREKLIHEPARDRRGWRIFSPAEAQKIVDFSKGAISSPLSISSNGLTEYADKIARLDKIDWNFIDVQTNYLTHGLHPYPAKFIPQIPNALIQELSSVGETVADIFCGSGTTLVEALLLKRHTIGIDANPLACLISQAKTRRLESNEIEELRELLRKVKELAARVALKEGNLFYDGAVFKSDGPRISPEVTDFWFEPFVVEELAELLKLIGNLKSTHSQTVAKVAFSAIVVAVSRQDSDTRYVRRKKKIDVGDTFRRYQLQFEHCVRAIEELSELVEPRFRSSIYAQNILDYPEVELFDLVVCSPPYPNAYSYHLYHRTRMLWLGLDQETFKIQEIGSHRKYSSKGSNRATEETFRKELFQIFTWLRSKLRNYRHACFVVGNSTLNGKRIDNAALLASEAEKCGFREVKSITRTIQQTRKSFNPSLGKIGTEKIVILQRV